MADITLVKISALPVAEQIGDEDLLALAQDGATKALAYGTIKDDISAELAPDATLSDAGKAADAKAVGDALALKADVTEVTAEVSRVDAALATKANTNDVNAALATKANADDVTEALALKADSVTVNAELATKADTDTVNAALALKADKTELTSGLAAKQNVLTFDSTPTEGSNNPVTSGGVYGAVNALNLAVNGGQIETTELATNVIAGRSYNNQTGASQNSYPNAVGTERYIAITPGADYAYSGRVYAHVGGVCFYDANGAFLSSQFGGSTANYTDEPVSIPEGAVYINASTHNNTSAPLHLIMTTETEALDVQIGRNTEDIAKAVKMNHLYVATTGSDSTGDGTQNNPFATLFYTNEQITDNSELNRYTIHVADGIYTDLQTRFAGSDPNGETQGIHCKDYVYYEGNINNPAACKLIWNGADGYDTYNYETYGVYKCIFHIKQRHTGIRGFCLESTNTRYCLHIETAGNGRGAEWEVSDCVLIWHGQPDCSDRTTATSCIGTGSGNFEKGHIVRCKIVNDSGITGGFMNHDSVNRYANAAVREGAEITIESCVFNGGGSNTDVIFRNINGDGNIDGYDRCAVKNCIGINTFGYNLSGGATACAWRAEVKCSDITDNVFETEGLLQ